MKIRLPLLLVLASFASTAHADDDHFVAGITAFKAGNYQEASTQLKQSLDANPTATTALYLGNAYLKLNRLGQAKRALNQALRLDPASPKHDKIVALIADIDARTAAAKPKAPAPPAATPAPAPQPAPPPPAPVVTAAPVVPPPAPTAPLPPQPDTPLDADGYVLCTWAPYKEAWACPVTGAFGGGRFTTPPDYRQDDVSEQRRRHSWVAGLKVAGARARGRQGVFVPQKDGSWLFVPGPLWSPHDLVTMPAVKPVTASTTP
jgi:hypothetical protein